MEHSCGVLGIGDPVKTTKMAASLLDQKALTRWCCVAQEVWVELGGCTLDTFQEKIHQAFID